MKQTVSIFHVLWAAFLALGIGRRQPVASPSLVTKTRTRLANHHASDDFGAAHMAKSFTTFELFYLGSLRHWLFSVDSLRDRLTPFR